MRVFLKLCIGILIFFLVTGCFAEDYDVGVPTAHLNFDHYTVQLAEANISWKTASEDAQQSIENIAEYASSLDEIIVFSGQKGFLSIEENEENGGDIWTDATITAALLKDDKRIQLEMSDSGEFRFPADTGNYILEVEFTNSAGKAQYVGNIVIEPKKEIEDGKLPEFFSMDMPSFKKVNAAGSDGIVFDHSYEEVCWNTCDDHNNYHYPDIHSGNVEKGDKLQIDWLTVNPQPSVINFILIDTENEMREIKREKIDIFNTPLELIVDEEMIGSQYALEFLWLEGGKIQGRSMLNFRLE